MHVLGWLSRNRPGGELWCISDYQGGPPQEPREGMEDRQDRGRNQAKVQCQSLHLQVRWLLEPKSSFQRKSLQGLTFNTKA